MRQVVSELGLEEKEKVNITIVLCVDSVKTFPLVRP